MGKEAQEKIQGVIQKFEDESPDAGYGYEVEDMAKAICVVLDKLGYRKLPKGKPPLLGEEEILKLMDAEPLVGLNAGYYSLSQNVAQAQWNICVKHYVGAGQ